MTDTPADDPWAALDPDVRAALERRAAGATPLWEKTAQQARGTRAAREPAVRDDGSLSIRDHVITLHDRDLPIRIYQGSRHDGAVIVLFHGGGFVTGDLDTHHDQALMLAEITGRTLVSVGYRLAPEHPFPAANHDAFAAIDWVRSPEGVRVLRLGGIPHVAVAGMSAGANLAANASREFVRRGRPLLAQLLAYPWLDATQDAPSRAEFADGIGLSTRSISWYADQYLATQGARQDPAFSPLQDDRADQLPPTVLSVAMLDPLRDDGLAYARLLQDAGVEVALQTCPTLPHGFWGMSRRSSAADAASRWLCARFAALLDRSH